MSDCESGAFSYQELSDAATRLREHVSFMRFESVGRRLGRLQRTDHPACRDGVAGLLDDLSTAKDRLFVDADLYAFDAEVRRLSVAASAVCNARALCAEQRVWDWTIRRLTAADGRRQARMRLAFSVRCRVPRRRGALRSGRPARRSSSRSSSSDPPGGESDPAACVGLHAVGTALEAFLVELLLRSAARVGLSVGEYALQVVEVGHWDEPSDLVDFLGCAMCAVEVSA